MKPLLFFTRVFAAVSLTIACAGSLTAQPALIRGSQTVPLWKQSISKPLDNIPCY